MRRARALLVLLGLGAALPAAPAAADWLVTSDGTRIETSGPWEVKGAQVIFTLPDGRLSALRAADVDLEASEEASRAAAGAAETPAVAGPRKAVRAITNETLAAAAPGGEESDQAEAGEEEPPTGDGETVATADEAGDAEAAEGDAAGREPAAGEPVEVVSWSSREGEDGLEIVGTLRNTGASIAAALGLTVTVAYDDAEEGEAPFRTRAFLDAAALTPGASTGFRARLPGIFVLAGDPSFEVSSEGFSVGAPPPPAEEAEPEDNFGLDADLDDEPDAAGEPAADGEPAA